MDWTIKTYSSVSSTQDVLRESVELDQPPQGLVIHAMQQETGRGRHGREWVSPMGNLYMSVYLKPECKAQNIGQLAFVAGLALSRAIDEVIDFDHVKTHKWPNDILIDDKKCAGILIETVQNTEGVIEYVYLGMGVNILTAPEHAICLKDVAAETAQVFINPMRDLILEELGQVYQDWQNTGFEKIRKSWLAQAHNYKKLLTIKKPNGQEVSGIFTDIDGHGQLVLDRGEGDTIKLNTGEIFDATRH